MNMCAGRLGIVSQTRKRAPAGENRSAPGFSGVMRWSCSTAVTRGAASFLSVRNDLRNFIALPLGVADERHLTGSIPAKLATSCMDAGKASLRRRGTPL